MAPRTLILASTSRYRRELLSRLAHPFDIVSPGVDEAALAGETPAELALRLARAKAQAVATKHPEAIVIGSDQVADLQGEALGKPGSLDRAREQLRAMRGRSVVFQTAVAVRCVALGVDLAALVPVRSQYRALTDDEIERYLSLEQPLDCAGSSRIEGLGITLVEAVESDDPTALIGLPLIRTCQLLRQAGLDPLVPA